jgi:predicted nucleic acid-binding protein
MNCVVDASVSCKMFFEEEHGEALLLLDIGNELHTPDLLLIEFVAYYAKEFAGRRYQRKKGEVIQDAIRSFSSSRIPQEIYWMLLFISPTGPGAVFMTVSTLP